MKAVLRLTGMHCPSCAMSVDDALEELDGVRRSKTSYGRARSKIEFDEQRVDMDTIRETIAQLGYRADSA